jgi:hypothetical protein
MGSRTASTAQLALSAEQEARIGAAKLIRYTYDGWARRDVDALREDAVQVYMPLVDHGRDSSGNGELSMIEASMGIRPTKADHHMAWETLTHAGIGQP